MNKTLSDVADKLTDDEKDIYDNLSTNAQKRAYLEQIESESLEKANEDRGKQVKILKSLTEEERKTVLTGTDSKYLEAQSALYALNNNTLYDTIDALKESGSYTNEELTATEELGQQLLENLSTEEAYNAEENKSVEKLTKKIATMAKLKTESGDTASIAEILTSDDYTLIDKVNAYNATLSSLSGSMRESFKTLYNQFEKFASFDEHVLKYIEKSGLTTDDLNTLYTSYTKLQKAGVKITQKEYQDSYDSMLQSLAATNGDIAETVNNIFGSYLDQFKKGSEE
jgi:hypothetical protein